MSIFMFRVKVEVVGWEFIWLVEKQEECDGCSQVQCLGKGYMMRYIQFQYVVKEYGMDIVCLSIQEGTSLVNDVDFIVLLWVWRKVIWVDFEYRILGVFVVMFVICRGI